MRALFVAVRVLGAAGIIAAIVGQLTTSIGFWNESGVGDRIGNLFVNFFSFFTIDSNVGAVVVFAIGAVLLIRRAEPGPAWFGVLRAAVTSYMVVTGIVYNTKSGKPRPVSWVDLISPNAKDQVIMPSPLYSGAAVIHVGTITAQPELGWNYYEKLADNGAVATKGNGGVLEAVASGQKAYGMIVDFMAFNGKAKGSPVEFVYPTEGVSMVTEPVAILKTAKNVDAAKSFVNWLLSDAGQQYMTVQGYIPGKAGVAGPEGRPAAADLKVMPASAKDVAGESNEIKKHFSDLFGG